MSDNLAASSLGLLFIGYTLSTWLFGVNTLQMYIYFQRYNDPLLRKVAVTIVFLSDMFNTIFLAWGIYMELVSTPLLPLQGNVPMVLESTAADVAIFIVQCFFAQSIYRVSGRNKWVTGLTVTLALFGFASGMALTGTSITTLYLAGKPLPLLNQLFVAFSLGMVTLTDIVITVSLIWYLYDGRSSLIGTTSHLLDGLLLYCIRRGILTTVSHVLVVALWFALPTRWEWTLFQFSLGKVYTLTYLTLSVDVAVIVSFLTYIDRLNRRESMKDRCHEQSDPNVQLVVHSSNLSHRTEEATESAVESIA